jgi:hypothetical protein
MMMTTRFICPFCKEAVIEETLWDDHAKTEAALYAHVVGRHPIRWRLSRRFRNAVRFFNAGGQR